MKMNNKININPNTEKENKKMRRYPNERIVKQLREEYPEGTRVKLLSMDDHQAPPIGTLGTVKKVDDIGSLIVAWDNGSSLHVIYGIDKCEKI